MASPSFEFKAPLVAYNTVLVLIPPPEITYRLNPFRRVHDKAGIRWTTHITMMCPFVEEVHLPDAVERLRAAVGSLKPFRLRLDKVDKFSMKGYDTVHLTVSQKEDQEEVQQLWKVMADILGYNGRAFIPHLTVGQAPNRGNTEALQLLLSKAEKILESVKDIDWTVGSYSHQYSSYQSHTYLNRKRGGVEEGRRRWRYHEVQ
jgi:2'-5' RNA ligase